MSSQLSERDEQVIELIEEDSDDELDADDYRETIQSLKDEVDDLRADVSRHDNLLNRVFSRIDQLEEVVDAETDDDVPPIVRKARMSPDERKENLPKSDQLAALLHIYWDDIRWEMGSTGTDIHGNKIETKYGVDTRTKANAKYNPSRLKYRLKDKAEQELHNTQVYRALRKLALDSGGTESTKNGRTEIRGGMYEYREVATPDGQDVRRVVWRDQE